jgi:hypothetical protein
MTIRIVEDGPDIFLTRSEHAKLLQEYEAELRFSTHNITFEAWLIAKRSKSQEEVLSKLLNNEPTCTSPSNGVRIEPNVVIGGPQRPNIKIP